MATFKKPGKLFENATTPVGSIISEVGRGVAQAQQQLDDSALDSFRQLYAHDSKQGEALRRIGYIPTWYQIPETNAEVNLSLSMGISHQSSRSKSTRQLLGTTIDASVQNRFNFKAELGSKVSFKIVPIPPPVTPQDNVVVPELIGRTLAEAVSLLEEFELAEPLYDGDREQDSNATITGQSPAPGEVIARSDPIRLFSEQS